MLMSLIKTELKDVAPSPDLGEAGLHSTANTQFDVFWMLIEADCQGAASKRSVWESKQRQMKSTQLCKPNKIFLVAWEGLFFSEFLVFILIT